MHEAIELANLCEALHCLPLEGGLYNQDPWDMYRIKAVLTARSEKSRKDQADASRPK